MSTIINAVLKKCLGYRIEAWIPCGSFKPNGASAGAGELHEHHTFFFKAALKCVGQYPQGSLVTITRWGRVVAIRLACH